VPTVCDHSRAHGAEQEPLLLERILIKAASDLFTIVEQCAGNFERLFLTGLPVQDESVVSRI
jgi:hypothetical protein